ncbi:hypothetical protein JCM3775_001538 [Rhodotorula graminis]|uniref:Uncharacterized protein n=1 Tax=Rhodotorula graminis (strain WP1) TaxID=578459 RepID=A0A194SC75_RHOGW|nr:uncharacterized protein RHOBADRAFT_50697 [Rhodotorula graminis WP1]KPV78199.1 hypothetical protein RHOBADRAFT_50697 [Rhodotorula graminis WP1]
MPARSHDHLSDRTVLVISLAIYAANAFLLAPSTRDWFGFLASSLLLVVVNCAAVECAFVADRRKLVVAQIVSISAMILVVVLGFFLLVTSQEAERVRDKVYPVVLALYIFVTFLITRCSLAEQEDSTAAVAAEEGQAGGGAAGEGSSERADGVRAATAAAAAADGASDVWAGEASGQSAKGGFFSSAPPAPPGYAAVPSAEQ